MSISEFAACHVSAPCTHAVHKVRVENETTRGVDIVFDLVLQAIHEAQTKTKKKKKKRGDAGDEKKQRQRRRANRGDANTI